ncbi:MAG TPA: DUF4124 domain-containing protein [Rhodanobacteraceae bacterium]
MRVFGPSILLLLLVVAMPAAATTVYKCVDAHGRISYRDTPCPRGQHQALQQLHAWTPPPTAEPAPTPAASAAPAAPPVAPRQPRVPPPTVFLCTNVTNGKTYLSQTGITRPYLAPLGMLGGISVPLDDTYGARNGRHPGSSVPEFMPTPPPSMVSGHYTWVRDFCRPLPPDDACAALDKRKAQNDAKLAIAFPDQQPPLLKERKRLTQWMAGCP